MAFQTVHRGTMSWCVVSSHKIKRRESWEWKRRCMEWKDRAANRSRPNEMFKEQRTGDLNKSKKMKEIKLKGSVHPSLPYSHLQEGDGSWNLCYVNTSEILSCLDKTISPVPPSGSNTTVTCPEFTCMDGSCVPFNMVSVQPTWRLPQVSQTLLFTCCVACSLFCDSEDVDSIFYRLWRCQKCLKT